MVRSNTYCRCEPITIRCAAAIRFWSIASTARDVVERIAAAGFIDVRLLEPPAQIPWNLNRRVVVARRN